MTEKNLQRNEYLRRNHKPMWLALNIHRTHKGKPITFKNKSYLSSIYLDKSEKIVIIKSTQSGISEFLWVFTVSEGEEGKSIFYVLPTQVLKNQYVANRIDTSIVYTPYYIDLIKNSPTNVESVSLKNIGPGCVTFVFSNTKSAFTSFAADDVIIDELDQCNQENILMSPERQSASENKRTILVSNPTIEGFGIDDEFSYTDKKKWFVNCTSCGKAIHPDFFEHVVKEVDKGRYVIRDSEWEWDSGRDIQPICHLCGKPYDRFAVGQWVKEAKSYISGYQISKMFSTNVKLRELVDKFSRALTNDELMVRFYNGDLGVAYTSVGAKITEHMLNDCIEDYIMPDFSNGPCVMGVDVGNVMHVRIAEIIDNNKLRSVYIGEAKEYEDLVELYKRYNVKIGVIDAEPELRLSRRVVATLPGMFMCFYSTSAKNDVIDVRNRILTIIRTPALDAVKEAVLLKNIILPKNVASITDYYKHMTASTRVLRIDDYVWEAGSKADHLFHAENYMTIARRLLLAL